MAGIALASAPSSSRVHRRPRHKFKLGVHPYVVTPCAISAVWPGESLVNFWFEAREVSPPLVDAITGWGSEFYLFYCKLSDLVDHPSIMGMLIDPTNAALTGTGTYYNDMPEFDHKGPYPNFFLMCYERIIDVFFRDKDEPYQPEQSLGPYQKMKFRDHGIFDSLVPETIDDMAVPPSAGGMDDLARAQDLYDYLVAAHLTDMSYSDWCAAYGVKIPHTELNEPELLVKWTEWVYPSNTVDPATGTPSSAISLVVKKNFNEPRYFKEPGFLILLHGLRPKVYSADQRMEASSLLNTALAWLPAMLSSDPATSLREFVASEIITTPTVPTDKVIVDMRDLPVYGDQFTNVDRSDPVFLSMDQAGQFRYPKTADLATLFKSGSGPLSKVDGFINLDIVGRITDYTTTNVSVV